MFIPTLILTIILIALVFAGIGLRILLVKGGEFRGTCATNNPMLKNQIGECTVCGKKPDEECKQEITPMMQ
ncbi:MAG: hypothetical protein R3E32_04830 [Chitinophagales bacterium]